MNNNNFGQQGNYMPAGQPQGYPQGFPPPDQPQGFPQGFPPPGQPQGYYAPPRKRSTFKTCLGWGCGCATVVAVILGIVGIVVWLRLYDANHPENVKYEGKLVSEFAAEYRLPVGAEQLVPQIDGVYKHDSISLRFKEELNRLSTGKTPVDVTIIDNGREKTKEVDVIPCGGAVYDLKRKDGTRVGVMCLDKKRRTMLLNTNDYILALKFERDPKKPKEKK